MRERENSEDLEASRLRIKNMRRLHTIKNFNDMVNKNFALDNWVNKNFAVSKDDKSSSNREKETAPKKNSFMLPRASNSMNDYGEKSIKGVSTDTMDNKHTADTKFPSNASSVLEQHLIQNINKR
jgi:hypothetical protein